MSNLPPPLTTAQVAEKCGVSVKTVIRWATSGTLPFLYKHPGLRGPYVFDRHVVERFRSERDAKAAS